MTETEYILEVKKSFFAREPKCRDLSDDNFKQGKKNALRKYSRFRPRKNSLGTANGEASNKYIVLPSDFMLVDYDQLYFLTTGIDIGGGSTSSVYYAPLSIFDNDLSATLYPPRIRVPYRFNVGDNWVFLGNSSDSSSGATVRLWNGDDGLWNLILPNAPPQDFERDYYYSALHQITDEKFTVPEADLDVFNSLVFAHACEALALDEASKDNPTKSSSVISYYIEMSTKYGRRIGEFQKYGGYI